MINNKRKITILLCITVFCLSIALVGCSNKNTNEPQANTTYSNLRDIKAQDEVQNIMLDSGIKPQVVTDFLASVVDYNEITKDTSLVEADFVPMMDIPVYDEAKIQELWENKYEKFAGLNCRITSFFLMKDFINIEDKSNPDTNIIFMDLLSIENSPLPLFTKSEVNTFEALYSVIKASPSSDMAAQYSTIKAEWSKRKITFSDDVKASLISVYLHSAITEDEQELFIGHTGVLFPTQDGRYLFIEKLAFQLPYQATYFPDKVALYDYLMKMYDLPLGENTSRPIILENANWMANTK